MDLLRQSSAANAARTEAREIQRHYPAFFLDQRVRADVDLAHVLGFRVEERAGLRQRAQLEILGHPGQTSETIAVRSGLERSVRRFAIAHEIGHSMLLRRQPEAYLDRPVERREFFANVFAANLLTTPAGRHRIAAKFPVLSDPVDLLRLAADVGLSPHALLTVVSWFSLKRRKSVFR